MVLWFAGGAFAIVWSVFHDPRLDHRFVIAGALSPDVVDGIVWRGIGPLHTLVASAALLVLVVVGTIGRRPLRRRLLALPMGVLAHLLLDGMWTNAKAFWWPFLGGRLEGELPSLERPLVFVVALELIGLGLFVWASRQRAAAMAG